MYIVLVLCVCDMCIVLVLCVCDMCIVLVLCVCVMYSACIMCVMHYVIIIIVGFSVYSTVWAMGDVLFWESERRNSNPLWHV